MNPVKHESHWPALWGRVGAQRLMGGLANLVLTGAVFLAAAGARQAVAADGLIATNATWKLRKGTAEASSPDVTAWRSLAFSDAAWTNAVAPVYYGESVAGGTQLADMRYTYTSFFLRRKFVVTNSATVTNLVLTAACDDGFVAWINGASVASYNPPTGEPLFTSIAARNATEPAPYLTYALPDPQGYLLEGTNVLAVQVFNTSSNSSDILFYAALNAAFAQASTPPIIQGVSPAAGVVSNLTNIAVTFNKPVTGVQAADLLINQEPATSVVGTNAQYTFGFPQPPFGLVQISWNLTNGITDRSLVPAPFNPASPESTWQYELADPDAPVVAARRPAAGQTVRFLSQVEIFFSEPVTGINASDLWLNGQPAGSLEGMGAGPYVFRFPAAPAGKVTVAWAPSQTITDLSPTANFLAGGSWTNTVEPQAAIGDLVINEFMAENVSGLKDENGEAEDWIEIHNRGRAAVNLDGWSLSNDPDQPSQWFFPAINLPAGGYLVVFASGKDRRPTTSGGKLHTNFKLSAAGEYLGLFSPESPAQEISALNPRFPEQRNDVAYGRDAAGSGVYFQVATPGAANSAQTITQMVAPVHFSVKRGFFNSAFRLALATETPGATIRYTLNGSLPTPTNGFNYSSPLYVNRSLVVRAAAFQDSGLPSKVDTHTYLYGLSSQNRQLPALSLVTDTNHLIGTSGLLRQPNPTYRGIAWERPVSAELIRPEDNDGFQVDAGLRVQGGNYVRQRYNVSGSLPYSKFSFRLYFRGAYGAGRLEYPLFPGSPVQSFDTVSLRAGMNDHSNPYIRDEFIRRLGLDMGQVGSHGTFVNLFINGVYKGYYNPAERIDTDFLQSWHGGTNPWDLMAQAGEVREGDATEWNAMRNFITRSNPAIATNYVAICRRLDVTNFVDYLLPNIYAAMGDWPHNNWRAARERAPEGKYRFYIWDGEWSFGYNHDVAWNTLSNELAASNEIPQLYQRLRLSPEFRLLFADRAHRAFYNDGPLTDARIRARYDELKKIMATTISGFNDTIGTSWIPKRRPYVLQHLTAAGLLLSSNAPVFNRVSGRVPRGSILTMATTTGVVFYTTNGADPRLAFSNTVAPDALEWGSGQQLTLAASLFVRARTLLGTNWSAVTEASFQVAEVGLPLRITEIMYQPPGGDVYEFVEFRNGGATPINLSGLSWEGIDYRFPEGTPLLQPGERRVVVSNEQPAAFAQRYPAVAVAGYFGGKLSDQGERLAILDRAGKVITSVTYLAVPGWPATAAGGGASLECIQVNGDPDDPANWRASASPGGSPGSTGAPPPAAPVVINELMAENRSAITNAGVCPDWIELYNAGDQAVDLGGWSLSDGDGSTKFVFPAAAQLPAAGYLVVWCDGATNAPGWHAAFGLKRSGESVFLYDASARCLDAVSFGPQLVDCSIGRAGPDGDWTLTEPTPGGLNEEIPLAAIANVVINEWMANPVSGSSDWLELYNRDTNLPVNVGGLWLTDSNTTECLRALSFIEPGGWLVWKADATEGPEHLPFKLSASGGMLAISDATGTELDRVIYGFQREGFSRGRLPDGSGTITNFVFGGSPGLQNAPLPYAGPRLNEFMARNELAVTNAQGRGRDWIELYHPGATEFDLSGYRLALDRSRPDPWVFPAGTRLAPRGFLVVWCDGRLAAATGWAEPLNLGASLEANGGVLYLINPDGMLVDWVEYGFQLTDGSVGRVDNQWNLLARPTPGAANSPAAPLGSASNVRLNEWRAADALGEDWFELYNVDDLPVNLSGLYLTNDPSLSGVTNYTIGPLTFIAGRGFVKWVADDQSQLGPPHLNFTLDSRGGVVRLSHPNLVAADVANWGAQPLGASEGRVPDGGYRLVGFPLATPAASNYLPMTNAAVNEVLAACDAPLASAIELLNLTDQPLAIGGWYLSDSASAYNKYPIPAGTVVAPQAFLVFYQYQFDPGPGATNRMVLEAAQGGEIFLSEVDTFGEVTGVRASLPFGPAEPGISFGRHLTSLGFDSAALGRRTLGRDYPSSLEDFRQGIGGTNAYPLVGPVVLSEVMYQPADTNAPGYEWLDEYVELRNLTPNPVALGTSTLTSHPWKLMGGLEYDFPTNTIVAADGYLLVVSFDPERDPAALAAFCLKYQVPSDVRILGPYVGRLENEGERLELYRPVAVSRTPGAWINMLADAVSYSSRPPWPPGAAGAGASLQRLRAADYGNEAANWTAADPTAGRINFREDYPVRLDAFARDPNGAVQVRVKGLTHQTYQLEWSTDLVHWTLLSAGEADDGHIDFSDPGTADIPQRFYRARQAP